MCREVWVCFGVIVCVRGVSMCRKWSSEEVYRYGEEVDVCEDGEGGDRREFERRSGYVCGGGAMWRCGGWRQGCM